MNRDCSTPASHLFLIALSLLMVLPSAAGADTPRPVAPSPVTWEAAPVDVPRLLAEDEARRDRKDVPYRVGFPMKTDLTPATSGVWYDAPEGGQIWRLTVRSRDARWLVLGFSHFALQPGSELYVADQARRAPLGPFTSDDIRPHGQLWFPPLSGDTAIVELRWPERLRGVDPTLRLGTVSHGYKAWGGFGKSLSDLDRNVDDEDLAPDVAGACNVDVACPSGDGWEDQARSVVLLLAGGSGFCTGSLVNNAGNDCTPFVLTAAHCNTNPAATTYQFNYENELCGGGAVETGQTLTGSSLVATYGPTDMVLVELDQTPPEEFNVFYSGWNNSSAAPTRSTGIHHPSCDVKKISHNEDALINGPGGGSGWGPDHWRVTEWEDGTTESCSSGSPLFDENQRLVGQLHDGTASCGSSTYDEYGKLSVSWDGGGTPASRLSDWLDPDNTGIVELDGIDHSYCLVPRPRLAHDGTLADDSQGNGDGVVDPGDVLNLSLNLENEGDLTATGVLGTLSTTTPLVTLNVDQATWPDLAPLASLQNSTAFAIVLDSEFPCGEPIDLRLDVSADEDPFAWSLEVPIPTGAAELLQAADDDMEGGTGDWTTETLLGSNSWLQTNAEYNSETTSWFAEDVDAMSDSTLTLATLSALAPGSELTFEHLIRSENGFDGGVLEYTTNGIVWNDAGGLITEGSYDTLISTLYGSPIGGRQAWSGYAPQWQTVRVDLASLAGADVTLRWRFASDASIGADGWYVDDVAIESTSFECNVFFPVLPGEVSGPDSGALFSLAKAGAFLQLAWSAPATGGPVDEYRLYSMPIDQGGLGTVCEGSLGTGTMSLESNLPENSGFLVVAENASGEGSYGTDGEGTPRAPASVPCP